MNSLKKARRSAELKSRKPRVVVLRPQPRIPIEKLRIRLASGQIPERLPNIAIAHRLRGDSKGVQIVPPAPPKGTRTQPDPTASVGCDVALVPEAVNLVGRRAASSLNEPRKIPDVISLRVLSYDSLDFGAKYQDQRLKSVVCILHPSP